ncbi:hypothetical protein, partial [Streptococcus pneumoniae]|uniref:hypothetical protein n=1 Tax=Streptococcus pneumoniae TaxID=1313 RepID=UPI0018B0D421
LSIALREHPGCTAFMRHYEAWQIMAAQGPTPMPTVAEVMSYGVMSQAEAEAYVAAWDPIVEWDQHRSRQHLADFAEMLLA